MQEGLAAGTLQAVWGKGPGTPGGVMLIVQLRACFWLLNHFPWSPEWTKLTILLGPGR